MNHGGSEIKVLSFFETSYTNEMTFYKCIQIDKTVSPVRIDLLTGRKGGK